MQESSESAPVSPATSAMLKRIEAIQAMEPQDVLVKKTYNNDAWFQTINTFRDYILGEEANKNFRVHWAPYQKQTLATDGAKVFFAALRDNVMVGCSYGALKHPYVNARGQNLANYEGFSRLPDDGIIEKIDAEYKKRKSMDPYVFIESVAVVDGERNRGIEKKLLKMTYEWAIGRASGCDALKDKSINVWIAATREVDGKILLEEKILHEEGFKPLVTENKDKKEGKKKDPKKDSGKDSKKHNEERSVLWTKTVGP